MGNTLQRTLRITENSPFNSMPSVVNVKYLEMLII